MARRTDILTPDNVELTYELAGLGSRFVALFVDSLIQVILSAAVVALAGLTGMVISIDWRVGASGVASWTVAVAILLFFVVWWVYFPFFETRWNGQTPGKRLAGIRVLRDHGFPLDFRGALIRNIVRVADGLPGVYGLGALFVLLHPQCKRLGDLAAGTIVIRERQEEPVAPTTRAHLPGAKVTRAVTIGAAGQLDLSMAPIQSLSREQLQAVKTYLERRDEIDLATQQTVAEKIAEPLMETLGLTPEDIDQRHNDFLSQVVETFERQQATKLEI